MVVGWLTYYHVITGSNLGDAAQQARCRPDQKPTRDTTSEANVIRTYASTSACQDPARAVALIPYTQ